MKLMELKVINQSAKSFLINKRSKNTTVTEYKRVMMGEIIYHGRVGSSFVTKSHSRHLCIFNFP